MRKSTSSVSTLGACAAAVAIVGAASVATPALASGATSAAKKVGGPATELTVRHDQRAHHVARQQDASGDTEFSSSARTAPHNTKWK